LRRVGVVFVVGEERGSDGATFANEAALGSRFLINGEPTESRLGRATRGVYRVRLKASGRAAHTSRPELGESAIEKLVDALVAMRAVDWPDDAVLGRTHYTAGVIKGGVAPNVIPAHAEAEIMFRTVGAHDELRTLLERHVGPIVDIEDILVVPPVTLTVVPGFETDVFSFTTDIPFLDRWGAPLLFGPGSVTLAHTADECVPVAELHAAVDAYVGIARQLLDRQG
jgi:acetylornithine deacetylase